MATESTPADPDHAPVQSNPPVSNPKYCGCCEQLDDGTFKVCGRCGGAQYCSRDCQAQDWPGHKALCKLFAETKKPEEDVAPGKVSKYKRVIFFHPDKETPDVIWVHRDSNYEDQLLQYGYLAPGFAFEKGRSSCNLPHNQTRASSGPEHAEKSDAETFEGVWVVHRRQYMPATRSGSRPNTSFIAAVRAVNRGVGPSIAWSGPIILSRERQDMSMADYTSVVRQMGCHRAERPMANFPELWMNRR